MGLRVIFYCPDRHMVYDGHTPDELGVGGGVSARVRVARALARGGHEVVNVVNCRYRETIDGVDYLPLDEAHDLTGDVLVLNTSGGAYDLTPASDLGCDVRLTLVWAHGLAPPAGLDRVACDGLIAVSNFVADSIRSTWAGTSGSLFVAYNGFEETHFVEAEKEAGGRQPYRLAYISHPSKGLDTAIDILQRLRSIDARYQLIVCGGAELWGEPQALVPSLEGVRDLGLIGQRRLAVELMRSRAAIQMQDRKEPGALAIVDVLRAGCVLLGSRVGCYPEMVADHVNGLLIGGDHRLNTTRREAAEALHACLADSAGSGSISETAQRTPWSTDAMAQVWSAFLKWKLGEGDDRILATCERCRGAALRLIDGLHCTQCGKYATAYPWADQHRA